MALVSVLTVPAMSCQMMQHASLTQQHAMWCRWYRTVVGSDVCKIDLMSMLLFNETEGKDHPLLVWRKRGHEKMAR